MIQILILKHGALGDVIRTSYILPGLYKKYEKPKITWFTSPMAYDLLRFNPYISDIITITDKYSLLADTEYDVVISLDEEMDILYEAGKVKCKKEYIGAFLENDKRAYTDSSAEWFDMSLISKFGKLKADALKKNNSREHNQILERMLGVTIERPIFFNSPCIEETLKDYFDDDYYNIGINSGAGSVWPSKELPINETIKLIMELLNIRVDGKETRVYLLGGKVEKKRHERVSHKITSDRLIDMGNENTLLEFAAIIKRCNFVITSDSLALHLAISQNVSNLSFFAPTSAAEIGTFDHGAKLQSTSADYCTYRKNVSRLTITAKRLLSTMNDFLKSKKVCMSYDL